MSRKNLAAGFALTGIALTGVCTVATQSEGSFIRNLLGYEISQNDEENLSGTGEILSTVNIVDIIESVKVFPNPKITNQPNANSEYVQDMIERAPITESPSPREKALITLENIVNGGKVLSYPISESEKIDELETPGVIYWGDKEFENPNDRYAEIIRILDSGKILVDTRGSEVTAYYSDTGIIDSYMKVLGLNRDFENIDPSSHTITRYLEGYFSGDDVLGELDLKALTKVRSSKPGGGKIEGSVGDTKYEPYLNVKINFEDTFTTGHFGGRVYGIE